MIIKVKEIFKEFPVSMWGDFELTILGNMSVGLNVTELKSLSAMNLRFVQIALASSKQISENWN